ncbi:hypothetical protein [Magnetospirillum sulfuroxidans]|uniref:Uncharacterized protein n=1 Tax=Magnetospirillum sulfuroxidans TaxID=611300 RepID=A0ABS5I7R1_9PROT|nr:hypothetical protein [Magnetospirillum sulfuroxidans]MBR9970461.1 hypothetical protein [Magnetospirillum sulfuroxidans]
MTHCFSDLVVEGQLPETVHPMPDLLNKSAEAVLAAFRDSQRADFSAIIGDVNRPETVLHAVFAELAGRAAADNPFHRVALFRSGALERMFLDLHDHVMGHPVWRHPFFVRVFDGDIDLPQLRRFATSYFNQIKNTRQCVAMAIGRFHGLMDLPYGPLNERVAEITQISLAQLVADEYGLGSHDVDDYPDLGHLFRSRTHIVMYRQLFDGLGIAADDQDQPMLWGVADNVLIQRLVAGDPAFTPLEALASVGLGMEWGVPEFFSLLLGGMIRVAQRDALPLNARDLEVFIAHVRYDVLHAVSVMLVTSLHMNDDRDVSVVKNACNTLMAGRYGMMTDVYAHVFGEKCPALAEIALESRYRLTDARIEMALLQARHTIAAKRVVRGDEYRARTETSLVFA